MRLDRSYKKGFTLVETLIAILLLGLLMSGASTLAQQALQISSKLKDDTVALFLAQEGMELVRYQRDTNRLSGNSWLDNIVDGGSCKNQSCIASFDPSNGSVGFKSCTGSCLSSDSGERFIYYNPALKMYTHEQGAAWAKTPYTRLINIVCVNDPSCNSSETEIKVVVIVEWDTRFGSRTYTIEENLLDWQ